MGIQPLDELCSADKAFVFDTAVEPFVGKHHGIAENDVQPERCAESKNQRVPAVINLEGPDCRAGERCDPLRKQGKNQREKHPVKPPDNELQKKIICLVAAGTPAGLDHFAEGRKNGDFQKTGDVWKFVDEGAEIFESGQICRTGAGNVDPAPATGSERKEVHQGSKEDEKQNSENVRSFHAGNYPLKLYANVFNCRIK